MDLDSNQYTREELLRRVDANIQTIIPFVLPEYQGRIDLNTYNQMHQQNMQLYANEESSQPPTDNEFTD